MNTSASPTSNNAILAILREEVDAWRAIADGGRYSQVPNRFVVVDHVGRIGAAGRKSLDDLEFVVADPSLIGLDIGFIENAQAGARWAGPGKAVVMDVTMYARDRAATAQAELDRLIQKLARCDRDAAAGTTHGNEGAASMVNSRADKIARRAHDSEAFAAAGGNLAQADRAREVKDDAALRGRVVEAVVREMGLAAPPAGSKSRDELADRLFHAVSAHSLARVELLSERLRGLLQEAYYQSENDAGAYGPRWRREIVVHGKRGLSDESDAALLERVLVNVGHDYLLGSDGRWFGDNEPEFLAVMARDSQVEMVRAAIVEELHDFPLETAQALGQRYTELGMRNPYEVVLLDHEQRVSAAAPSPR